MIERLVICGKQPREIIRRKAIDVVGKMVQAQKLRSSAELRV